METEIYNWIKNIVIYMIINTIIMNLLGNKSYKKYVSIVSGMILVLIVISPLVKLMKLNDNLDYFLQYNYFSIETSDFKNQLEQARGEQEEAIFTEYRQKIKEQVRDLLLGNDIYLKSCNITMDEDPDSSTYGQILAMNITAGTDQTVEASGGSLVIDRIEIPQISIDQEENQSAKTPSPLEITIKNELSDFYNMDKGNINISIQGG
jgi:stage III sporulation protein AF